MSHRYACHSVNDSIKMADPSIGGLDSDAPADNRRSPHIAFAHAGHLTNLRGLLDRFTCGEPDLTGLAKPEVRPHGPSIVIAIIE
jgi:hypothetical protein